MNPGRFCKFLADSSQVWQIRPCFCRFIDHLKKIYVLKSNKYCLFYRLWSWYRTFGVCGDTLWPSFWHENADEIPWRSDERDENPVFRFEFPGFWQRYFPVSVRRKRKARGHVKFRGCRKWPSTHGYLFLQRPYWQTRIHIRFPVRFKCKSLIKKTSANHWYTNKPHGSLTNFLQNWLKFFNSFTVHQIPTTNPVYFFYSCNFKQDFGFFFLNCNF